MVDNETITNTKHEYGPESVQVSTDGGWLLRAKENHDSLMAQLNAERAENDYHSAVEKAQKFSTKLFKIFGLNLPIEPGTTSVVIDGLRFTNGPRYDVLYWQVCANCGEPAIDFDVYNTSDLASALETEGEGKRLCETCERQSWITRTVVAATPEPTPLETLGAALVAYIQSIRTEE